MADSQFPDLGITQQQDGEYWNITIPSLETSTKYGFRFAWVFPDDSVSEFSDVFELTTPAAVLQEVTNLKAVWVGSSLKVTFDKTSEDAKNYQIVLEPLMPLLPSVPPLRATKGMDNSKTEQEYILTFEKNYRNFSNVFRKQFKVTVQTTYLDGTSTGVFVITDVYQDKICTNTIAANQWSVVSTLLKTEDNSYGFLVTWKDDSPNEDTYNQTRVYMSDTPTGPWTLVYTGKGPAEIGPILDFNTHYVKINHQSLSGCETVDSDVKAVKAIDLIRFKDYPPNEFTDVSAAWIVNANSLNDLSVTFKLPSENIGTKARIFFTVTKDGQDTEEFFDKTFPEPFTSGSQKTVKIFANEIYGRFGSYNPSFISAYSGKKGRISSVDQYDNASSGVAFDIGARPNPLATHTPTISVVAVENGYKVSNTNTNSKIDRYEVYSSKSSNGPFNLVYSGILPAFILDTQYTVTYVKVKALTLASDASSESSVALVTPLSVAQTSLIEFPVAIGTEGSIWSGPLQDNDGDGNPDKNSDGNLIPIQDGARAFFNRRGFFIYDDDDNLTTQIIGDGTIYNNPYAGTGGLTNSNKLTFITKSAQIANWRVSTDRIENTLDTPAGDTYTGMSGSGTFAFWAGGNSSGNLNSQAKFQVTHAGKVTASNIDILGGKLRIGSDSDSTAPFLVTSSGFITAAGATINGSVNAVSGKLGEVDVGGTMKVIDTNSQSPTFGKLIDKYVDGQIRVATGVSQTIEMGKLTLPAQNSDFTAEQNAILTSNSGIQITNSTNKYVQLDTLNGILANRGYIGGWKISSREISFSNNIGLYAGAATQTDLDPIRIWAGAGRNATVVPFYVTDSGNLFANNAIIAGNVYAKEGGFGNVDPTKKPGQAGYIDKGWIINSATVESTGTNAMGKVVLDGENATISGGWIYGAVFWLQYPTDSNGQFTGFTKTGDYISSDGDFKLGNGNIEYNTATGLSIGTAQGDTDVYFQNVDFYMGAKNTNSINKFLKNGYFSIGNGTLRYDETSPIGNYGNPYTPPGSSDPIKAIMINASNIKFTDYTGTLRSNRNGNAAERTLAIDDNGFLTSARRFIYEGTTDITNSGTKFGTSAGTDLWNWNGVNFQGTVGVGDIVMVGDNVLI